MIEQDFGAAEFKWQTDGRTVTSAPGIKRAHLHADREQDLEGSSLGLPGTGKKPQD